MKLLPKYVVMKFIPETDIATGKEKNIDEILESKS